MKRTSGLAFLTYYSRFFHLWLTPSPVALAGLPRPLAAFRSFLVSELVVLESGLSGRIAVSFAITFPGSCIAFTGWFGNNNILPRFRQNLSFFLWRGNDHATDRESLLSPSLYLSHQVCSVDRLTSQVA
jgi:hypothetical protein